MSPEDTTKLVWDMFNRFSDEELCSLLDAAGVVPTKDRGLRLHQALVVWFHGFVPSTTEIARLDSLR